MLAGKLGEGGAFALTRWEFDRFQCSMRPDPAPPGCGAFRGLLRSRARLLGREFLAFWLFGGFWEEGEWSRGRIFGGAGLSGI